MLIDVATSFAAGTSWPPPCFDGQTMVVVHVPSLEALASQEQDRLAAGLRLASLRSRRQEVQRLTELVARLVRAGDPDGVGEQLVEEMAWLGCHLLEAAATLCGQRADDSGVFVRAPETSHPQPGS